MSSKKLITLSRTRRGPVWFSAVGLANWDVQAVDYGHGALAEK